MNNKEKIEIYKKFPHKVQIEDWYDVCDEHCHWCYQQFGHEDGECNFDDRIPYEEICPDGEIDYEGYEYLVKKFTREYYNDEDQAKRMIGRIWTKEHSHEGVWKEVGVKKTGYDYGIVNFCFKNKEDMFLFILNRL